jgi:hypothetical protein
MRRKISILFCILAIAALVASEKELFPLLKTTVSLGRQPAGFYLLPTNQLLRPWGEQTLIKGRPVDVAMDSRKQLLAILNWRGVVVLDAVSGAQLAEARTRATSYIGIAFRPGDREVWASETSSSGPDNVLILKLSETGALESTERIKLEGHAVPCGIAFSSDGNTAYVALSLKDSVAVIDAKKTNSEADSGGRSAVRSGCRKRAGARVRIESRWAARPGARFGGAVQRRVRGQQSGYGRLGYRHR